MPAAMMHLTVLVSLLTVAVCSETTTFSELNSKPVTTTGASHFSSSLATSPAVKTSTVAPLAPSTSTISSASTTHPNTTHVTSASPTTPRAEEPNPSTTAVNTTTSQVSNGTATRETMIQSTTESQNITGSTTVTESQNITGSTTVTESQNVTGSTTANTTSPALSTNWGKNSLAENPGLVAIICIFSIVLALMIVVVAVKCVQSPRSNFERLEDVPMGKVTEESPFAHFSK